MAEQWTAGCRQTHLADEALGAAAVVLWLYPAEAAESTVPLGRYSVEAAAEAPVASGRFPLVVISHGTGSSPYLHRGLARHLARAGYIVACPEHPFNNRNNNSLADKFENLEARPRLVRLVVDWAESSEEFGRRMRSDAVAVVGHSLGGYTALAVAGGKPTAFPHETDNGQMRDVPVRADGRVKAIVLMAPATPWFRMRGALNEVRVPVLMMTGEKDEATGAWHAGVVRGGLPEARQLRHVEIAGAGHFSFLTPFPEEMRRADFAPSQDPPGFDRERFTPQLYGEIQGFLDEVFR